ncbi:MAG: hypothetical protein IPG45_03770 [Deltaproteobacteria bacterium]|nr:hypothetical protein [Deltaproteobacteria bacterium]
MAKGKKKKDDGEKQEGAPPDPGIAAFEAGHYPTARRLFQQKLSTDLAEGERRLLTSLLAAMRLDDHAWKTGLGCIALYLLVIAIGILKQP